MLPDSPTLTVILPAFNSGKFIQQAIDGILKQAFSDFELFIVDDGSTDNTLQVVRKYSDRRIRVFEGKENKGKVPACNGVVSLSRGKYLTIHDSDDYSHPDRFEKQIDFLEKNPAFGMCGSQFYEISERGDLVNKVILETNPDKLRDLIQVDSQFHGPTMVFRKDILETIGGLYRNFRNKEDVDLAMRIAENYRVINLEDYLYYYRLIPQGLSKSNFDFLRFDGLKVLHSLARQRRETGADCLMRGDLAGFEKILLEIKRPYVDDPSLLYRKAIALSVYFKFWGNAYRYALKAIVANPWKRINYREFLYVVKVSMMSHKT